MAVTVTARRRRRPRRGAPRVGPAGRMRGGTTGRIRWDRVGRIALLATLGGILLLYASPAKHWLEQSTTRSAQRDELSQLSAENARLKRKVRAYSNPQSLEHEARRLGMVKRGERSYVIENPPGR